MGCVTFRSPCTWPVQITEFLFMQTNTPNCSLTQSFSRRSFRKTLRQATLWGCFFRNEKWKCMPTPQEANQKGRLSLHWSCAGTLITVWDYPVTFHYNRVMEWTEHKGKCSASRHLYWRNVLNENITQFHTQKKKSKRILCPQPVWIF
jgi:hypothetical protein